MLLERKSFHPWGNNSYSTIVFLPQVWFWTMAQGEISAKSINSSPDNILELIWQRTLLSSHQAPATFSDSFIWFWSIFWFTSVFVRVCLFLENVPKVSVFLSKGERKKGILHFRLNRWKQFTLAKRKDMFDITRRKYFLQNLLPLLTGWIVGLGRILHPMLKAFIWSAHILCIVARASNRSM